MGGLYAPFKDFQPTTVLPSTELDALQQYLIDKHAPQFIDDYSVDATEHALQAADLTSLPTNLAGEIEQLRKALALVGGVATWTLIAGPVPQIGTVIGRPFHLTSTARFLTTNGILALAADQVLFSDGTRRNSVSASLDLATVGPAANGRDVAGNFQNQFVHIYWIWNPTSVTVALTASATGPPTGPALPAGYTEWCYATTLRVGATVNRWLRSGHVRGSFVGLEGATLSDLTATAETTVSVSTDVPTIASNFHLSGDVGGTTSAGGSLEGTIVLRMTSGVNYKDYRWKVKTGYGLEETVYPFSAIMLNVGQQFLYLVANLQGTLHGFRSVIIDGYNIPNGDC